MKKATVLATLLLSFSFSALASSKTMNCTHPETGDRSRIAIGSKTEYGERQILYYNSMETNEAWELLLLANRDQAKEDEQVRGELVNNDMAVKNGKQITIGRIIEKPDTSLIVSLFSKGLELICR